MNGAALYTATGQALLGYQMDQTLFYQILAECQGEMEDERDWMILRTVDKTQTVSPSTALTANSLYLTPFNLPGFNGNASPEFLHFYEPRRAVKLIASDGITFRWLYEIDIARREEYKDDDTRFYIDRLNGQIFLCGTVDQTYTIAIYYIGGTDSITANTTWKFPPRYHLSLALSVAMKFRDEYRYDVVNAAQALKIERRLGVIKKKMADWDAGMQESSREGIDYSQEDGTRDQFYSRVVGDANDTF